MKETFYERIGEAVCRERLTNGLEVCVVLFPRPWSITKNYYRAKVILRNSWQKVFLHCT